MSSMGGGHFEQYSTVPSSTSNEGKTIDGCCHFEECHTCDYSFGCSAPGQSTNQLGHRRVCKVVSVSNTANSRVVSPGHGLVQSALVQLRDEEDLVVEKMFTMFHDHLFLSFLNPYFIVMYHISCIMYHH